MRRAIPAVVALALTAGATYARAQHADAPSSPSDEAMLAACGKSDPKLTAAASHVVDRSIRGLPAPTSVELAELLRDGGEPHSNARAWTFTAPRVDRVAAAERMAAWLTTLRSHGVRRCGLASRSDPLRGQSIAVVAVDAIADLRQGIPQRVRLGTWVTVDAEASVPASGAKVVVLGPRGKPRAVPTSFDPATGQIVGRFRADAPGAWLVQVLLSIDVGPLPVLEARVIAGEAPARADRELQAPGEGLAAADDAQALYAMLDAARATERLARLDRDADLDRMADVHVAEMMRAGVIGHDVGQGTPPSRLEEAGVRARETGENVAKAPSAALAHRALWWSPSHRGNMLHERYSRVGIAARRDARGSLWVAEVFAD